MSSFLVSKVHIDALLTAALQWAEDPAKGFRYYCPHHTRPSRGPSNPGRGPNMYVTRDNADETGTMLWRANFKRSHWDEDPDSMPHYSFEELPGTADPVVILKAIECYRYQTESGEPDEHDAWMVGEEFAFLFMLQNHALDRLPTWSAAPWQIKDREVFVTWAASSGAGPTG